MRRSDSADIKINLKEVSRKHAILTKNARNQVRTGGACAPAASGGGVRMAAPRTRKRLGGVAGCDWLGWWSDLGSKGHLGIGTRIRARRCGRDDGSARGGFGAVDPQVWITNLSDANVTFGPS